MGKKSHYSKRDITSSTPATKNGGDSMGKVVGILFGLFIALIIFSFSGRMQRGWITGNGVIVSAYTISEADSGEEAGYYADVQFINSEGVSKTERSTVLKDDLTNYIGKSMEIQYDPDGTGVLVVGHEKENHLTWSQIIFIFATIFVIYKISDVIKKHLPSPKQYTQR